MMRGLLPGEIVVDNFAGGGGASAGIEQALGRAVDIAINHDREAVAMHAANHPGTRHHCEDVWSVDPREATGGKPVGLAWFSPDCTFHSKARGGKPFRDRNKARRRRGLAWVVIRWAKAVRPRVICLENVEEFADWGPLLDDGQPCPLRKGFTFRRWLKQLQNIGYEVDLRELRACDYGAPTIRKRLFIIARCDGLPIQWPAPTHGHGLLPYRTAAECIDWSIPCPSIFDRDRPLVDATLRRIARGVHKYVIAAADPFIVPITHTGSDRVHSIREPVRTITTAARGELALAVPTLIQSGYGERCNQAPRVPGLDKPLGTVVAGGTKHALVAAFLAKHYGGHETPGQAANAPLGTVTTVDHHAVVAGHLLNMHGSDRRARALNEPAPTTCAGGNHAALVAALMAPYYGSGSGQTGRDLRDPAPTVTSKDRLQLVTVEIDHQTYVLDDIGMRMLAPRELYRAQGFPDNYVIDVTLDGKRLSKSAQVRMCGNGVCPPIAAAIVAANFAAVLQESAG